ncbi:MAG: hypothetical protein AAF721_08955 [Myxococcota bacterium]
MSRSALVTLALCLVVPVSCADSSQNDEPAASTTGSQTTSAASESTDGVTPPSGSDDTTGAADTTTGGAASSTDVDSTGAPDPTTDSGADACANGILDGDETDVDCGGSCTACPIGGACGARSDCAAGACDGGSCVGPSPTCDPDAVQGAPGNNWGDSYSADGRCYCDSTFDHAIGEIEIDTPVGTRTVLQICEAIGAGPGSAGNPVYNDIQCGNGPANDAGDEDWCPGRVDQGEAGCCIVGPTWDLSVVR